MEQYYKNIDLHTNDIIKKQSIQQWQEVDEFSRVFDFDQIGLLLYDNIIIILYHSDTLNIDQIRNIIKSKFNTLIFYSQPEYRQLTRIAKRLLNKNSLLMVIDNEIYK